MKGSRLQRFPASCVNGPSVGGGRSSSVFLAALIVVGRGGGVRDVAERSKCGSQGRWTQGITGCIPAARHRECESGEPSPMGSKPTHPEEIMFPRHTAHAILATSTLLFACGSGEEAAVPGGEATDENDRASELVQPSEWWNVHPRPVYATLEKVGAYQDWFDVYRLESGRAHV